MFLEMNRSERELMMELVESRLSEIGSEIRRCMNSSFQGSLKQTKETLQKLQKLQHRLHEAEWDVTC